MYGRVRYADVVVIRYVVRETSHYAPRHSLCLLVHIESRRLQASLRSVAQLGFAGGVGTDGNIGSRGQKFAP